MALFVGFREQRTHNGQSSDHFIWPVRARQRGEPLGTKETAEHGRGVGGTAGHGRGSGAWEGSEHWVSWDSEHRRASCMKIVPSMLSFNSCYL